MGERITQTYLACIRNFHEGEGDSEQKKDETFARRARSLFSDTENKPPPSRDLVRKGKGGGRKRKTNSREQCRRPVGLEIKSKYMPGKNRETLDSKQKEF